MNRKILFALWGGLFILCAGLGFIPEPEGGLRVLLTALAVLFFLPPALLLYDAERRRDTHTRKLIRDLSALSLGLTVALLIGNFFSVFASEALGRFLHTMLIILSSPMICGGHWAMSLFLWACLLLVSLGQRKR